MWKWRVIIIRKENDIQNVEKKPKKAPLVYINRLKMTELDENNKYTFIPDIIDKDGKHINRDDLSEVDKKKFDQSLKAKISRDKHSHMILTAESELIRIIMHLSDTVSKRQTKGSKKHRNYVDDILSLKVGRSYTKYKDKMKKSECIVTYNGKEYKRIIVSSSHSRTQKAMLVYTEIWDKAMDILLCGINPKTEYKFMSKWNSYIGLAATDSVPVTIPNIVVVDDKELRMKAKVDVVQEVVTRDKEGNIQRKFNVLHDKVKRIPTNLFDGAGVVTVEMAEKWKKDLNLDYIPASFQFRCIPCLKGKLYVMPVKEFAEIYKVSKIIDINGKEWDLFTDKIDCILTKSQFKFHDIYETVEDWRKEFDKEIHGYKRTFNISEYDVAFSELKDTTVMAYQPLQTLSFTQEGIEEICIPTVNDYKKACSSVDEFLKFRGICSEDDDIEWSKYPTYYQAMYYNHSLFNDEFIKKKVRQDLKSAKERAYVGKIKVKGNYQTLTPDLYALLQHIFGLPVTGLLKYNEIYSNYWNHHLEGTPWVDIIRSPHIAMEHSPVQVVTSGAMEKWFAYQKTGIIVGVFGNTIALKANSADYDGDHVLSVNNPIICEAAINQFCNTIYHEKIEYPHQEKKKVKVDVSDIETILDCDYKGYKNNIGNVINPISVLWSLDKSQVIHDYIKVMSIVGSITIDYAKHGEETDIPTQIKLLLRKHKKPYFMKYLRSGRKKRSLEKELQTNGIIADSDIDVELFDDVDCTMNQICHYMEQNIGSVNMDINEEEKFQWEQLIKDVPDITSHRYKKVRDKLIEMQEWLYEINNIKYKDVDESDERGQDRNRSYDALYEFAKTELVSIISDESELLDILLVIFYSDKKFMNKHRDKSILWGCFGNELVERSKGNFSHMNNYEIEKLVKRSKKAEKHLRDLKAYKEEHFQIWEFENEENAKRGVSLYKEDIRWIKQIIPTKTKRCTDCRRLLFVLLYVCRKCNTRVVTVLYNKNSRITKSVLCKMADIDARYFNEDIKILADLGILSIDIDSKKHLTLELLKVNENYTTILKENVPYQKIQGIVKDKIREKSNVFVKDNCA